MAVLKGMIKAGSVLDYVITSPKFEDTLGSMILKYADVTLFGFDVIESSDSSVTFGFKVSDTSGRSSSATKKMSNFLKKQSNKGTILASLNIAVKSAGYGSMTVENFEVVDASGGNDLALKLTFAKK